MRAAPSPLHHLWHVCVMCPMCVWKETYRPMETDLYEYEKRPTWEQHLLLCITFDTCVSCVQCFYLHAAACKHKCISFPGLKRVTESCHMWTSHVTHVNESCHSLTCEWVMSRVWSEWRHIKTHAHIEKHTHMSSFLRQSLATNGSFICVTWLFHMCDMTHSHEQFPGTKARRQMVPLRCTLEGVPWLIYVWDMTHSYVWHDAFTCVTWLFICDHKWCLCAARWTVGHDSCTCGTWLIHMCATTHSYMWQDSYIRVRHDSCICVTSLIHVCGVTHSYVWHDSIDMCAMSLPSKNGEIALQTPRTSRLPDCSIVTELNLRRTRCYLHYWYG